MEEGITSADDVQKGPPTDERGRLQVTLSSWVGHNKRDGEKFGKWTGKA